MSVMKGRAGESIQVCALKCCLSPHLLELHRSLELCCFRFLWLIDRARGFLVLARRNIGACKRANRFLMLRMEM